MACSFASSSSLWVSPTFDVVDGVVREDLVSSTFAIDALDVVDDVAFGDLVELVSSNFDVVDDVARDDFLVEAASADGTATFDVDAETGPFDSDGSALSD